MDYLDIDEDSSSDLSIEEGKVSSASAGEASFDSSQVQSNLADALDKVPAYYRMQAEGSHTWEIEDITKLVSQDKVYGPKFHVGDSHVFNVLMTTQRSQGNLFFSVYLEGHPVDPAEAKGEDWHCCVQFALDVWDPEGAEKKDDKDSSHSLPPHKFNRTHFRYNAKVTDWGFINLLDGRFPTDSALIQKKRLNITAYVRVVDDVTGVLWSNFEHYDSRKATGFVGINNQGATCYLNSLLQSYFFTRKFRKKVYQIPTEDEVTLDKESFREYLEQPHSVSLALQRIFYNLQTSPNPVDTMELTSSFGWTSADAFTQHDVQEMNRILMDKLEGKMKHTEIEGCLNDIFVGKMKSFVRCVDVEYESSRVEDFWDIQLNVKGLQDIRKSFDNYVELELLDGENKYDASGYGLQAAEKGVVFESFPPVLHLQLKRFEYNFELDQLEKVNDRYEFFDTLDLKPYLDKEAAGYDENWEYRLHCVLVHQGDVSMGHYYAMIRPAEKDEWFRFDDDKVWRVTPDEVYEQNFGADLQPAEVKRMTSEERQDFTLRLHTSAYMLVYVRKAKSAEALADVQKDDVPAHVRKQITYEREQIARIHKEQEEMHLYANFKVYTSPGFAKYQGFDLGPNEEDRMNYLAELYDPESMPLKFRLLRTDPFSKVYDEVKKSLPIDPTLVRFWIVGSRKNYALRPADIIKFTYDDPEMADVSIEKVISEYELDYVGRRRSVGGEQSVQLVLFLEDSSREIRFVSNSIYELKEKVVPQEPFAEHYDKCCVAACSEFHPRLEPVGDESDRFLILVKFFDYEHQTLLGVGHACVSTDSPVDCLTPLLNNLMGYPINTALKYYEELGANRIDRVPASKSFYKCELGDGDILCFTKAEWSDTKKPFASVDSFYSFLANRLHFSVGPLQKVGEDEEEYVQDGDEREDTFELWVSLAAGYKELAKQVGAQAGVDPSFLRLFILGNTGQTFPLKSNSPLKQLLGRVSKSQTVNVRYEVLSVTLADFEQMALCRVHWVGQGICRGQRHEFFMPKTSTLSDLVDRLQGKVHFKDDEKDALLCWTMDSKRRLSSICTPETSIDDVSEVVVGIYPAYKEVLATKPANIRLVTGFQFFNQIANPHSLPFVFDLIEGEQFRDTKVRLHKLLGISDREFEGVRIAVTDLNMVEYLDSPARDSVQLFSYAHNTPFFVAIDHPDRNLRRASAYEQSIRIRD